MTACPLTSQPPGRRQTRPRAATMGPQPPRGAGRRVELRVNPAAAAAAAPRCSTAPAPAHA
eukprot:9243182-Pyramimonas_sp.AAC.1